MAVITSWSNWEAELLSAKGWKGLGTIVRQTWIRISVQLPIGSVSLGNGIESRESQRLSVDIQHLKEVPKDYATKEKLMLQLEVDGMNMA